MRTRLALAAGVLTLSMLAAQADAAEEPSASPLRWDPAWTHASAWDYTLTAVGVTSLLVETALFQNRAQAPRWSSPILFDSAVRGEGPAGSVCCAPSLCA
jgi:hypothetical protein